jgi:predicted nucleotidyltransferase
LSRLPEAARFQFLALRLKAITLIIEKRDDKNSTSASSIETLDGGARQEGLSSVPFIPAVELTYVPIIGTIVPVMGTSSEQKDTSAALFGKTRRSVLALFFMNPERSFYVREVIRELGLGRGTVQRELQNLTEAGLLVRSVEGNQVHFRANADSPVFSELKSMMVKTAGIAEVIGSSLAGLSDRIRIALLYGSIAGGTFTADSDIDLLVIGETGFKDNLSLCEPFCGLQDHAFQR